MVMHYVVIWLHSSSLYSYLSIWVSMSVPGVNHPDGAYAMYYLGPWQCTNKSWIQNLLSWPVEPVPMTQRHHLYVFQPFPGDSSKPTRFFYYLGVSSVCSVVYTTSRSLSPLAIHHLVVHSQDFNFVFIYPRIQSHGNNTVFCILGRLMKAFKPSPTP